MKSQPPTKRSKCDYNGNEFDRDKGDLSPIELLPKELISNIIEYATERVFDLRLSSRLLRAKVDEYANLRVNIPLAVKLEFVHTGWSADEDEISAHVPKNRAKLFELRLQLRNVFDLKTRIKRSFHGLGSQSNVYKLKFSSLNEKEGSLVKECMSPIVGTVSIFDHVGRNFEGIIKQLDGIQFKKLIYSIRVLSQRNADQFLHFLKSRKIDHLSIGIGESRIPNTFESFLLEISSVVRSLYLWQREALLDNNFIASGFDWARIVPDMFTRRMDALCIDNFVDKERPVTSYLSGRAVDALLYKLPLAGKPIWFESRLNLIGSEAMNEPIDITINGHVIERKAVQNTERRNDFLEHLSAKHESRVNETCRE